MVTSAKPIVLLLGQIEHAHTEWDELSGLAKLRVSNPSMHECGSVAALTTVHRIHLALRSAINSIAADIVHDSKSMKGPGSNS